MHVLVLIGDSRGRASATVPLGGWLEEGGELGVAKRIEGNCLHTSASPVLRREGMELVVELGKGQRPVVVTADERLSAPFIACVAEHVQKHLRLRSFPRLVSVVMYDGDFNRSARGTAGNDPVVRLSVQHADAPLTRHMIYRWLNHYLPHIRRCFHDTYKGKASSTPQGRSSGWLIAEPGWRESSIGLAFTVEMHGGVKNVETVKTSPPGAAELGVCLTELHYRFHSSIVGEQALRVRVTYNFRVPPNRKASSSR